MRFPVIKNAWLALAVVAAAQSAVLGYMIYDRASLLRAGREVVLPVVPVDPRSLFQGDYVILGYDISRLKTTLTEATPQMAPGKPVFVTLSKGADGTWAQSAFGFEMPPALKPEDAVLQGRIAYAWLDGGVINISASYGIEQYFVEEGTGKEIEEQVRDRKIAVLLAVDASGRAAIKALMADGEIRYREPLL